MSRFFRVIFLFLVISVLVKADSLSVYPAFYYTYGNYSSNASSNSYAGYVPLVLNLKHTLVLGYDNLRINTTDWKYDQKTYIAGTILSFDPVYLKFNYAYLGGDYAENTGYSYKDKTHILNPGIFFRVGRVYLGVSYVHLDMNGGIIQQTTNQFTGRLEWIVSQSVFLSVRPSYVRLKDGRNLTSVAAKIHFMPSHKVLLKAGVMIGKRAYYFDPDLLTIFNQDETQKDLIFGQLEYSPGKKFTLILAAQHTSFDTFSINYYIAGIKTNFSL